MTPNVDSIGAWVDLRNDLSLFLYRDRPLNTRSPLDTSKVFFVIGQSADRVKESQDLPLRSDCELDLGGKPTCARKIPTLGNSA